MSLYTDKYEEFQSTLTKSNDVFHSFKTEMDKVILSLSLSFAYPFPDVVALMDILYISRSSAVRPTLQTLAPIQSSTSFSQDHFDLPLFLWPFAFPSSIIINFAGAPGRTVLCTDGVLLT